MICDNELNLLNKALLLSLFPRPQCRMLYKIKAPISDFITIQFVVVAVYQPKLHCTHLHLSVCVYDNSKNNGLINLKHKFIVVCGKRSDDFDIGHCPIKVKDTGSPSTELSRSDCGLNLLLSFFD